MDNMDVKEYKRILKAKAVWNSAALTDRELLELILSYVLKEDELSRELEFIRELAHYNGNEPDVEAVSLILGSICKNTCEEEKRKSNKKFTSKTAFLRTVEELFGVCDSEIRSQKKHGAVSNYDEAGEFFRKYMGGDKSERFCIAFLSGEGIIIDVKKFSVKDESSAVFDSEKIAKHCVIVGAKKIIIAHNHTSGSLFYSKKDWFSSFSLASELKFFNIVLVEHYVVTRDGYKGILKSGIASYGEEE